LGKVDIAIVNLVCAGGLSDAEHIDHSLCTATIDAWAQHIGAKIADVRYRFDSNPGDYENSWAYFRVLVMITVLQRDFGVRYNLAKIPANAPFDVEDSFIHGIIQGAGGTCASMPVLYAAVGRRLGFPIKLVHAKGERFTHVFARWDEPDKRFNIE